MAALLAFVILGAACSPEATPAPSPAPATLSPIVDSSPYICKFVPEQAFRMVTGLTGPLAELTDGTDEDGACRTPDIYPNPLGIGWALKGDFDYILDDKRKAYTEHGAVTLPADLGEGLSVYLPNGPYTGQPYEVVAKFRCGGKERLLTMFFAAFAKGRDGIRDMIDLMRIAQKRYGHLYKCALGE
ncbi:hypothetical protein [Streptosporangium sp. NPDC049078]|uniref:hypothetical protein n=1 Tax=Streptosporangium sp. NPDC049078 TaxID=3155767 RepID=UPI00343ACB91